MSDQVREKKATTNQAQRNFDGRRLGFVQFQLLLLSRPFAVSVPNQSPDIPRRHLCLPVRRVATLGSSEGIRAVSNREDPVFYWIFWE